MSDELNQRRKNARLSLRVLAAFLTLQFMVQAAFDEPYPAIKMPGFGAHRDTVDAIYVKYPTPTFIYSNGESITVSREHLFRDVPSEVTFHAIDQIFAQARVRDSWANQTREAIIENFMPGYRLGHRKRDLHRERLKAKLLETARELRPDQEPSQLLMKWEKTTIDPSTLERIATVTESEYEVILR